MPRYASLTPTVAEPSALHDTDTSTSGYDSSSNEDSNSETSHSNYSSCPSGSLGCDISASRPLCMMLYEGEEALEKSVLEKTKCRVERCGVNSPLEGNAVHYILQLFDAVKGFHEGSLDLTGRHPQRYYSVQSQWSNFLRDFVWLRVLFSTMERGEYDGSGPSHVDSKTADITWRQFQQKWRLPYDTDYGYLLCRCRAVLQTLKNQPIPVFQQVHLLDLPTEILDLVFRHAPKVEGHALACTSHLLNNVGRRHIFRHWELKLGIPPSVRISNPEYSSVDIPMIAQYSRMNLLEEADFLLQHPHVAKQVHRLSIVDEWWLRGIVEPDNPEHSNPFVLNDAFYNPISQTLPPLLQCTSKMTELELHSLELTHDLIYTIFRLSRLRHLTLHLCRIPAAVQASILTRHLPSSQSISSLTIVMDSGLEETYSQWLILILCPHIKTLSVRGIGQPGFPLPHSVLWRHCHFDSIERLSLENLDISDIDSLSTWLRTVGAASGLRLTHFRLFTSWGISDADILGLLTSLGGAPLQGLVLEGLATVEFTVFERIAELFRELLALTLARRQNQNDYQDENRLTVWPRASWEYASYFQRFTRLRRFCWNFAMQHNDATPSALLAFENGFSSALDGSDEPDVPSANYNDEESCFFLDSHWMALPFAAYCPSLETLEIMGHPSSCRITRKPDTGAIVLKTIPAALVPSEWWDV